MPLIGTVLFEPYAMSPRKGPGKAWALVTVVLLVSVVSPWVNASSVTYSGSADFSSTSGHRGWTYWDSLGQEMAYSNSNARWECVAGLPWCYWTRTGGHPGSDRNVLRRWTPSGPGSARITGTKQKDSNACNANDGVYTRIWHETAQSNFYLTYTSPGPTQRSALPGGSTYMACSDANAYSFDTDAEIYPGDKIEFEIDRIGNNDADGTTFDPTIVFEPADAIGAPWTETSQTSITLRFNGVLKCPNGAACRYRPDAALPPDYYTVHRMGTITSGDFFVAMFDNWARCGPADGPVCVNPQQPSNFAV